MPSKKQRSRIPDDIQAQVLFLNDHRCCMCHKIPPDGVRVQIHQINENPSDHRLENLAVLCRDCHDKLKDKLWMGRRFPREEVKKYKQLWEEAVSEKRTHLTFPPAIVKEKIVEKVDEKGKIERHIERETYYTDGLAPQGLSVSRLLYLLSRKKSSRV